MFTHDTLYLRSWLVGALAWLIFSLILSIQYLRVTTEPSHLFEISGLLSLLWGKFGFAGLFHTLRNEKGRHAVPLALITLHPPLALFGINCLLAWRIGKLAYL